MPLLTGGEELPEDRAVLLESGGPYSRNVGIRTAAWAYFELGTGDKELYDLAGDPDQLANRAGDPTLGEVEAGLAARLAELRTCAGETCRDA